MLHKEPKPVVVLCNNFSQQEQYKLNVNKITVFLKSELMIFLLLHLLFSSS